MFRVVLAVAAMLCAIQTAHAQDVLYDADQFGNINLTTPQSGKNLEALLAGSPRYEELGKFSEKDSLRQLSAPIGRLDVKHGEKGFFTCTAAVISKQHILTNHHCIPGNPSEDGPVTNALLIMGYYDKRDTDTARKYRVQIKPVEKSGSLDYSILKVDNDPASIYGTVRLASRDPEPGTSLRIVHHPLGQPKRITLTDCLTVTNYDVKRGDYILHTCDTLPGSSGAPLFAGTEALGLHYSGIQYRSPGDYNEAKRMSQIVADSQILSALLGQQASGRVAPPPARRSQPPARQESAQPSSSRSPGDVFKDCELGATLPDIPNGATASAETLTAVMQEIKAFQAALKPYRECLSGIIEDDDAYDLDQRQAALDKFNASVDAEEKMAADWSETIKAYKARQDG